MPKPKINFFSDDVAFELKHKNKYKQWLISVALSEGKAIDELNYIFCSDEALLQINIDFLQHDTLTDIITFDNSTEKNNILGEIYISIDRVKENALVFSTSFDNELRRVLAHGLLHLCGYKDKTEKEQKQMREAEERAISFFPF